MPNLPYMPKTTRKTWGYSDKVIEKEEKEYKGTYKAKKKKEPKTKYLQPDKLRLVRVIDSDGKKLRIGEATTLKKFYKMKIDWYKENRPFCPQQEYAQKRYNELKAQQQ